MKEIKRADFWVCYLLNFCVLPQETADELSKHYNAIYKLIKEWQDNTEIEESL